VAETERTRTRERENPPLSAYEKTIAGDKAYAERQQTGRIVVRQADCPQEFSRQGILRYYLGHQITDTPLRNWAVFSHEVRTKSGKHRHQGGLVIYVISGKGYSVVDGERINWKKGDLLLLPLRPDGVEHQHFNENADGPSLWMAFIHSPSRHYLASQMTQTEISPDYAG
jgi:mannose-6-phosphate isomerase-like protein (cupin superfamily)